MKINSFEYFLNAVHYCIYKKEVWSSRFVEKIVWKCFFAVTKVFSLEKLCHRRKEKLDNDEKYQEYMYGNNAGQSIGLANHWFGYFYSAYSLLISFILGGFAYRELGGLNTVVKLAILIIPIGLCYIPAYKAVYTDDRYLKYYKQFEKEDEQWHKKWKRITIAFCLGSAIATILGIFIMFIIATW